MLVVPAYTLRGDPGWHFMAEFGRLRGASAKLVVPAEAGTQNGRVARQDGLSEGRGSPLRPRIPVPSLYEGKRVRSPPGFPLSRE